MNKSILLGVAIFFLVVTSCYSASISGDTDDNDALDVVRGGTNATTKTAARTNLEVIHYVEQDDCSTITEGMCLSTVGTYYVHNGTEVVELGADDITVVQTLDGGSTTSVPSEAAVAAGLDDLDDVEDGTEITFSDSDADGALELHLATTGIAAGTYNSITFDTKGRATAGTVESFEDSLGNPDTDGKVLSSTAAGVRSWVAQSGGTGGYVSTPTYSDDTCTVGQWSFDGTKIYICEAANQWDYHTVTFAAWDNPAPASYTMSLTIVDDSALGGTWTVDSAAYDVGDSVVSITGLSSATQSITYNGSNTGACTGTAVTGTGPWAVDMSDSDENVTCTETVASASCSGTATYSFTDNNDWEDSGKYPNSTYMGMAWSGSTINLCQVDVYLQVGVGDISAIDYELRVYNTSSDDLTGSALYTSASVSGADIPANGSGDFVSFSFSSGSLASGQALVLVRSDLSADDSNFIQIARYGVTSTDSNSWGQWDNTLGAINANEVNLTVKIYESN